MIRTYIFACLEKDGTLGRLAVNVNMVHGQIDEARAKAVKVATKRAKEQGMNLPHLMYEAGVPDIRVVLEAGQVAAFYYRNSEQPPTLSVTDLDYSNQPDKEADALLAEMDREGFINTPFFVPVPRDPRQPSS